MTSLLPARALARCLARCGGRRAASAAVGAVGGVGWGGGGGGAVVGVPGGGGGGVVPERRGGARGAARRVAGGGVRLADGSRVGVERGRRRDLGDPARVSVVCAWSVWRIAHRVGDSVSGHGPDADAIADGVRDWTVPAATALFTAAYLAVALVTLRALGAEPASPSGARVVVWSLLLCLVLGGTSIAIGAGRAAIWTAYLPLSLRAAATVCLKVVSTFLLASLATFAGGAGARPGRRAQRDVAAPHRRRRDEPLRRAQPGGPAQRGAVRRQLPARPRLRGRHRHRRQPHGGGARPGPDVPAAGRAARRRRARRVGGAAAARTAGGGGVRRRRPPTACTRRPGGRRRPSAAAAAGSWPASWSVASPRSPAAPSARAGCRTSDRSPAQVTLHAVVALGLGALVGSLLATWSYRRFVHRQSGAGSRDGR